MFQSLLPGPGSPLLLLYLVGVLRAEVFQALYRWLLIPMYSALVSTQSTWGLVASDIVLKKPLPLELQQDIAAIVGCLGQATNSETYKQSLENSGFKNVSITDTQKDLTNLYKKPGFVKNCACSCQNSKSKPKDTSVLDKYDLNEYAMSCIIQALSLIHI
eukprot:TRINITY_DN25018_c0_g1_i1.p2 TRINITY_DN25018_c0_g1~~TRINITY_DN25018_c0_g1_i1.p2  ORF type:complete len:160 (-),score=13.70 TRINITY_DN25018_c0_g1_i1:155-634(-)